MSSPEALTTETDLDLKEAWEWANYTRANSNSSRCYLHVVSLLERVMAGHECKYNMTSSLSDDIKEVLARE